MYGLYKKFLQNLYLTLMNKHEDHRYIEALRKGDSKLLDELYQRFSKPVINWVSNNSGSSADARDVFQDAIIALYNKACDPDYILTCPLGALLIQICKNKWIDQIRKKSNDGKVRIMEKERYESEQGTVSELEVIEEEEIRQSKLEKAFAQLSDLCRQMLKLYSEGVKAEAIRIQLDMENVNTLYRRKNACTERWRNLYNEN
jgi:RNA polymerase sigma factor (sigma-70 family)